MTLRIGFLASHNGSGMQAIIEAIDAGNIPATPAIIISNNAEATALTYGKDHSIPIQHISQKTEGSEEAADEAIRDSLLREQVDLVVLSGYMRRIGRLTLAAFPNQIINIHPALLPAHAGEYGDNIHRSVLANGETVTGATVHMVDEQYDHGAILGQVEVPVEEHDTVDSLRRRVQVAEKKLYVEVVRKIATGELSLRR